MRKGRLLLVVLVVLGGTAEGVRAADAGSSASVVMIGEAGDYIAPGVRIYRGSRQVTVGGGEAGLSLGVSGVRESSFGFSLEFTPPAGDLIAPGDFRDAERSAFREGRHPGIDISGDGRGCNQQAGRFRVRDVAFTLAGDLSRLWLLFEQHCEGAEPALFGEVRIGMPVLPGRARVLPTALRWPPRRTGRRGTTVPFTIVARRPVRLGRARVSGPGRRAFRVTSNTCRGRLLGADDTCRVYVRFQPRIPGTARAELSIAGGGSASRAALLGDTRVPRRPR